MNFKKNSSAADSFDLTCWYVNVRRLAELFGDLPKPLGVPGDDPRDPFKARFMAAVKNELIDWAQVARPPTLGQILVRNEEVAGRVFTHFSNYFCVGLNKWIDIDLTKPQVTKLPHLYAKLDDFGRQGARLSFQYHPEHLTSTSAWSTLTGQVSLFVLGLAKQEDASGAIAAIPYVIGSLITGLEPAPYQLMRWQHKLEVSVDEIDSFAQVVGQRPVSEADLDSLRDVPENAVKKAFAEIIGEPSVEKDWGGERSDMLSSRVILDGKRVTTAFAFKGPAQFKPMAMRELGKNGDQIDRLYSEPADLLVLQHCHKITGPVRGAMRAYASQMSNPRHFCLIDGFDTIRILRAYGKCGFPLKGKKGT